MSDPLSNLTRRLLSLVREGGDANRLVVEGGPGFVALRGARGRAVVEVEAAGGRHLPAGFALELEHVGRLDEMGLRQRTAASTFAGAWPIADEASARAAAERLMFVMGAIYRHGGQPALRHRLEDREPLSNPGLVETMARLSKERTMRARLTLYNRLLGARLAVLLDTRLGDPRRQTEARLRVIEQLAGTDVVAAFTDDEAHRLYDPRERPFVVWTGRELFPLLAARGVGSLLLNPGSPVRGELYRNEIMTISEGIQRESGLH